MPASAHATEHVLPFAIMRFSSLFFLRHYIKYLYSQPDVTCVIAELAKGTLMLLAFFPPYPTY